MPYRTAAPAASANLRFLAAGIAVAASLLLAMPAGASAAAELEAETTPLSFSPTGIHDPAATLSTEIVNVGDEEASVGTISAELPFSVDAGASDCDDVANIGVGGSCSLSVNFDPEVVGPAIGEVTFPYSDPIGPHQLSIPLTGTGIAGTLVAESFNFNVQPFFFGGQQQQINVTNVSATAVLSEGSTIAGPDAGNFNINSSNCNANLLQPGNSCSISVQFNPPGPGTFTAQLEIGNDGAVDPVIVPISVEVLSGPDAVLTPENVDFGVIEAGTLAAPQPISISNAGDFPLQIQQLLIVSGTPQVFPMESDECSGQIVAPGDECEIIVGFAPTKDGERNASIFVISNTPGPVTVAALSGEGMFAPSGSVSLTSQARVGVPIVCLTSGFRNEDALSYQWLRDGIAIAGETQSIYVPLEADLGARLSCMVKAANAVGTQTLTSAASGPVAAAVSGAQGPNGPHGKRGAKGKPGKRAHRVCKSHRGGSRKVRRCARKKPRGLPQPSPGK